MAMTDEEYMLRAVELAKKGTGWTNPNPLVGAVIVKDGRIIGEGYHKKYGGLHAEREALASANEDVSGATIYVTLEPCCHYGKQPPCVNAIIEAGIKRVVIGSYDPNPLVAGKGVSILRDHNIIVDDKLVCSEECKSLNYVFFNYIKEKKPYVILKYAQSLDGKIATHTGLSQWITGETARNKVHMDRHRYSAVMVGVETVIKDNPMLTCRSKDIVNINQPARVICDTNLRTPLDCNIVRSAKLYTTYIATSCKDDDKCRKYTEAGCKLIYVNKNDNDNNSHIDIKELIIKLGQLGIDSIVCEGGATLNWSVLASGMVDRIQAYIAPKVLGGVNALSPVGGIGVDTPDKAYEIDDYTVTRLGKDILIEGKVRCI